MKNVAFLEFGDIQMQLKSLIMDCIALQHRGQEGAGIVTSDGTQLSITKGEGLVTEIFTAEKMQELTVQEKLRLAMFVMQQQVAVDIKMFSLYYLNPIQGI